MTETPDEAAATSPEEPTPGSADAPVAAADSSEQDSGAAARADAESPAEEAAAAAATEDLAPAPAKPVVTTRKRSARKPKKAAEPPAQEVAPDPAAAATGEASAEASESTEATESAESTEAAPAPEKRTTRSRSTRKTSSKRSTKAAAATDDVPLLDVSSTESEAESATAATAAGAADQADGPEQTDQPDQAEAQPAKPKTKRKSRAKKAAAPEPDAAPADAAAATPAAEAGSTEPEATEPEATEPEATEPEATEPEATEPEAAESPTPAVPLLFQAPDPAQAVAVKSTSADEQATPEDDEADPADAADQGDDADQAGESADASGEAATDGASKPADSDDSGEAEDSDEQSTSGRRRRRRGGRRRRKSGETDSAETEQGEGGESGGSGERAAADAKESAPAEESSSSRRRRRRRRSGDDSGDSGDDPDNTVTRVRKGRSAEDEITAVSGSTRLEAKKQRRREGREAGRRRAPIVSEAEFLARRESVERVMVIRQREDLSQIAVLEDKVLVEHYVARESQTSLIGNVYLGRVQNVLPSMEAAFIDIGKGRNGVLYAGEVNWSALGHKEGEPRKIESVLSSGQSVLVQVTKDPVGHKGARLTSQISLAGRFLVYVPDGTTSGISRKLPDTERARLKTLLKEVVPESAGVIVRTAAEGAAESELTRDVERLKARWEDIEKKAKGSAPQMLYNEPDLTLKVVRDLFTEDFTKLVIDGDDAWDTVQPYVVHVAPDLEDRLERFERTETSGDVFAAYRIDEQIAKGLDRKVWLPSGGSLIIDRTEAMTVVDVNTGKFTGSGGNLEETVTKNNLEAAEEMVRQLRLRDIGGIIVIDFIDMVLESNRDLVLRRLVECLGRDRTRHQVAEVTSLGLVQMTRKRIGTGLLEAFSETCEHCAGRGLTLHEMPVEPRKGDDDGGSRRRRRGGRGRNSGDNGGGAAAAPRAVPSPADVAAVAKAENADKPALDEIDPEAPAAAEPETAAAEAPAEAAAEPAVAADKPADTDKPAETAAADVETTTDASIEPAEQQPAETAGSDETQAAETQPDQSQESEQAPVETAPKVVTRTRRRAASRPAGPPAAAAASAADEAPADAAQATRGTAGDVSADVDGTGDESAEEPPAVEHVPIKRRGRKR